MDFLVLAPPVCAPSEYPSGAFMLASALAARGYESALLDLSLELYRRLLESTGTVPGTGNIDWALRYLTGCSGAYDPQRHRTASGILHECVSGFGRAHPGWRLTLMDLIPPGQLHDLASLDRLSAEGAMPFGDLWESVLGRALAEHRPRMVLVSLSYLSQLASTVDLRRFLLARGQRFAIGGSLPNSLIATGLGSDLLRSVLPEVLPGDGSALLEADDEPVLDRLAWPIILGDREYLSSRPVIPLSLSTGCYWNRCLFCPDRTEVYRAHRPDSIRRFVETIPPDLLARGPVMHFIDSAMPPAAIERVLPVLRSAGLRFYGFGRPEGRFATRDFAGVMAENGCLMLQLGLESGSRRILEIYEKGLDPDVSGRALDSIAGAGIRTYAYLLFGLPRETDEDRERTLALIRAHHESVDFLNLSVFNLPARSELIDRADEFGIEAGSFPEPTEAIRFYRPFREEGRDPRREARSFINGRLRKDELAGEIIRRTPRWFRAAHLALMGVPGRSDPA
ncbi:radical SAM protein [Candidatus Fermentibacterales bacterium]|nr:radical SAM protein [Candidatus Fermentibacterales bacterium]